MLEGLGPCEYFGRNPLPSEEEKRGQGSIVTRGLPLIPLLPCNRIPVTMGRPSGISLSRQQQVSRGLRHQTTHRARGRPDHSGGSRPATYVDSWTIAYIGTDSRSPRGRWDGRCDTPSLARVAKSRSCATETVRGSETALGGQQVGLTAGPPCSEVGSVRLTPCVVPANHICSCLIVWMDGTAVIDRPFLHLIINPQAK